MSPRSCRATDAGRNTFPHSTAISALPRWEASAAAALFTSSSNSATRISRRGPFASTRRATACPTSPDPPSSMTVLSARCMDPSDGLDLAWRERAPLPFRKLAEPHRTVRHAVQPLDLEPQLFRETAHDPMPSLRQCQLVLDAPFAATDRARSEEHTSELQSRRDLVCR